MDQAIEVQEYQDVPGVLKVLRCGTAPVTSGAGAIFTNCCVFCADPAQMGIGPRGPRGGHLLRLDNLDRRHPLHLQNQSLTSSLPLAPAPWHPWKVGHTSGHTHTQKTQPPPLMPTTLPRPPPLTASLPAPPAPPLPGPPLARHYRSCPDHTCPCCQRFLRQLYAHSRACNGCCCSLACLHAKAQQCGVPATPRSLECVRTLMGMGRSCSSS